MGAGQYQGGWWAPGGTEIMIRLKSLLTETKGVPFPTVAPDMNRDGVVDDADLKAQARRRQAVINALRERMLAEQDIPQPNQDQSEMEMDGTSAKAELLSIHKKAGELYNMVGDGEQMEGWIHEKISKAAEYINAIHSTLEYEKSKPTSVGDGAGAPADLTTQALAEEVLNEETPKGWEATVLKMKKKKEIDNPWALAHWMKNKGYQPKSK